MNAEELGNRPAMNAVEAMRHALTTDTNYIDAHAALDRLARLVEAVKVAADPHTGPMAGTKYMDADDGIGVRVCCDVISYSPHAGDCEAERLRKALAAVLGEEG